MSTHETYLFFLIPTVAVVLLSVATLTAMTMAILILKDVKEMTDKTKKEYDSMVHDVHEFMQNVKSGGLKLKEAGQGIADDVSLLRERVRAESAKIALFTTVLPTLLRSVFKKKKNKTS